ncbi:DNA polymerase IV [Williamsoniiplasma luminosum]|uniref:DNA polymerase IV n=1 Tax=Williamsoniiplasma luminosum TaxID=214888 RepID=A0A2S0NJD1_9MOLU|nr:DNA polymerase IV [Williamsoniiplasma luminosum]AVP49130.1 MAG: DNA polymerase IV [Williamsoniiplasma luminosum]
MSKTQKVIFLIDMDAFFASASKLQHPELRNKAVVVAHDHPKSIISAADYQARAYGVKAAMPLNKAKQLCKDLVVLNPDFELYQTISAQIWNVIKTQFTSMVEVVSIDEAYVDVSNIWKKYGTVRKLALKIQNAIKQQIGLTCSIGVSYNKFLAKMGSDMDKPNGVTIIKKEEIPNKIWNLNINKMYGVGIATEEILKDLFHVVKIGDLTKINPSELEHKLGKHGLILVNHALGYGNDEIDLSRNISKSISNERTLVQPISNLEEIEIVIHSLTKTIVEKMQTERLQAKTMGIILRYHWNNPERSTFDKRKHLKHKRKQTTLIEPTINFETIFSNILECLNDLYEVGKRVSLIGVFVANLKPFQNYSQLNLDDLDKEFHPLHHPKVDELIEDINFKLKKNKLFYATELKKIKD